MEPEISIRLVDSYCVACRDVLPHDVRRSDPGACVCTGCGAPQQMMVPLEAA